jgi:hypothetical protein
MSDKLPVVVTGDMTIKEALGSPQPLWVQRRAVFEKLPAVDFAIPESKYYVDGYFSGDILTKGFPKASFLTRNLGLPSLNHKGRITFPEVFHDFEYISNWPFERFYRNTMKVIPLTNLYGMSFEVGRRTYTIGYPMPSNNLFGFDHRPDQAMSGIEIREHGVFVGGYEVPTLDFWRWGEHSSAMRAFKHSTHPYPEYKHLAVVAGGGLRRGQMSMTSACRTGRKSK